MDKMQKRYVNVKKVIETERGVDSEIVAAKASNNPYEGFRNKQQQKPQKRLIDRHLVNEVIKNEQQNLNDLSQNHLKKIEESFNQLVDDAMEWKCPETEQNDWENVSETVVKIIDYLTKHGKAVSDHLQKRTLDETTAQLRSFTQNELDVSR